MDEDGKQLVAANDTGSSVELGEGGSELVIKRRTNDGMSTKAIGSREFLRYYKQKPKPSPSNEMAISVALASRFVVICSLTEMLKLQGGNFTAFYVLKSAGTRAWV